MRRHPFIWFVFALIALAPSCASRRAAGPGSPSGVTVLGALPGASAQDLATGVALPLASELAGIRGVTRVITRCEAGACSIFLHIDPGVRTDDVAYEAIAVIKRLKGELPEAARVVVRAFDARRPPDLVIALLFDGQQTGLAQHEGARRFGARLMQIPDAVRHEVQGAPRQEMRVTVDKERAAKLGVNAAELARLLRRRVLVIDDYTTIVVSEGRPAKLEELANLPLRTVGNATVRVRDVARIERVLTPAVLCWIDGRPAVLIDVYLRSGASLAEIAICLERIQSLKRPAGSLQLLTVSMREN